MTKAQHEVCSQSGSLLGTSAVLRIGIAFGDRSDLGFFGVESFRRAVTLDLSPISPPTLQMSHNFTTSPAWLGRSIWRPLQPSGRVALGGRFLGLKPWAEFRSPCGGAKTKASTQECGLQPFLRSKIILNLTSRHSGLSPICALKGSVPNRSGLSHIGKLWGLSQGLSPIGIPNTRPDRSNWGQAKSRGFHVECRVRIVTLDLSPIKSLKE